VPAVAMRIERTRSSKSTELFGIQGFVENEIIET
jgi:hypothetical protein